MKKKNRHKNKKKKMRQNKNKMKKMKKQKKNKRTQKKNMKQKKKTNMNQKMKRQKREKQMVKAKKKTKKKKQKKTQKKKKKKKKKEKDTKRKKKEKKKHLLRAASLHHQHNPTIAKTDVQRIHQQNMNVTPVSNIGTPMVQQMSLKLDSHQVAGCSSCFYLTCALLQSLLTGQPSSPPWALPCPTACDQTSE